MECILVLLLFFKLDDFLMSRLVKTSKYSIFCSRVDINEKCLVLLVLFLSRFVLSIKQVSSNIVRIKFIVF